MKEQVTQITIAPDGEPLFSENAFTVSIIDEGAGGFLRIVSVNDGDTLNLDVHEWVALRKAVNKMAKKCRV